ncbi:MAG TPA: sulfotransferase domain-containing protein [Casimicrobiaceae bacterium]|nr:sulfotransferase domain-containing protein [Casimicrobiaceae bacterium]
MAGLPTGPLAQVSCGGVKVNFLGVGAQKAGTSALDAYLRTHPALCMAKVKEVHLFDDDKSFFKRSLGGYAEYHTHFAPTSAAQIVGEITPAYMYWNEAPRRIWEYNPAMKLIAVLRNPITRAHSHWNMERDRGVDPLPFWDALHAESARLRAACPYQDRRFSYVDRGFYTAQLRRLASYFPPEQILVLRYEELQRQPDDALAKVFDFLGVERLPPIPPQEAHVRPYSTRMSLREWEHLRGLFEFEIRALERTLDWDCAEWLRPPADLAE